MASRTFNYTGGSQSWVVPAGVSSVTIEAVGACGGIYNDSTALGTRGGYAKGTLAVTPGETLYVYAGGRGQGQSGGWNGGAYGSTYGGGGGGGTDVRQGGTAYANRKIVAGGGGGYYSTNTGGGVGGGTSGGGGGSFGGGGGSQTAGGSRDGALGVGGRGDTGMNVSGGGGGGGYYGGGGGGYSTSTSGGNGGGGGGSGYIGGVTGGTFTGTAPAGNGFVTLTWNAPPAVPTNLNPTGNILTVKPLLRATVTDPDGGNARAHFQVATDSGFTNIVHQGWGSTVASGTASEWRVPADLNSSTTYYFRALAEDPAGSQSGYSAAASFVTPAPVVATFNYTGGAQSWTVPANIAKVKITCDGAAGGNGVKGGRSVGTLAVTPGEVLSIYVGGKGGSQNVGSTGNALTVGASGGYNGGGGGGSGYTMGGYGGGGATDVRQGGTALSNRKIVAGGAGGAGGNKDTYGGGTGGVGGGASGATAGSSSGGTGGGGGTQSAGGAGGTTGGSGKIGGDGSLGQGGHGGIPGNYGYQHGGGGGAGGGYYGGGGGGSDTAYGVGLGGGGGSAYIGGVTGGSTTAGGAAVSGAGTATIEYSQYNDATQPAPSAPAVTAPNGGEVWDGVHNVTWVAGTGGNGSLVYNVEVSTDNGATWTRIGTQITGTSLSYDFTNIPASTAALVRVQTVDSLGLASGWDASNAAFTIEHNRTPTAPTPTEPIGGATKDRTKPITLKAKFNDPDAGDSVSESIWRTRTAATATVAAGAWTEIVQSGNLREYTYPAGHFATGDYEWQALYKDAGGLPSPWSASEFFTAATPPAGPAITEPADGATLQQHGVVAWTSADQAAFRVRRVADNAGSPDSSVVYYDSGRTVSATTRDHPLTFEVNNRYEHIQVQVESAAGLLSVWASVRGLVGYTSPATPEVRLAPHFVPVLGVPKPAGFVATVDPGLWPVDVSTVTFAGTGTGTMTDPTATAGTTDSHNWTATLTTVAAGGGTFTVAKDGVDVGTVAVGAQFVHEGLSFTINDGATDFALNDAFSWTTTAVKTIGSEFHVREASSLGDGIRRAKDLPPNASWIDLAPASDVEYQYRAKVFGDNGTTAWSPWAT